MFRDNASREQVKMIEIKLSQGAKPAHGGLLPKEKISPNIAKARGLGEGPYEDCNSPPSHSAFRTPTELAEFIATLRNESGGKPVGIKLCVGRPDELAALVRGFVEVGGNAVPDFITVDGAEGGTGAAPPEFSNRIGCPLLEGLSILNGLLIGANLRQDVRIIGSGRVVNGFDLVKILALGADFCNSARAMMFALGCIQALQCNTNKCPTGIATTNPKLMRGLNVDDKSHRVFRYQAKTVQTALEIIGACGLERPSQMRPEHVMRRVNGTYAENLSFLLPKIETGELIDGGASSKEGEIWKRWWDEGGKLMHGMKSMQ
jgi:glutamate synthase domain-containing protein 2